MIFKIEKSKDRRLHDRGNDRRLAQRYQCSMPVSVRVHQENPFTELCEVMDISTFGVRLKMRNQLNKLTDVTLKFFLPSEEYNGNIGYQKVKASSVSESVLTYGDGVTPTIYQIG